MSNRTVALLDGVNDVLLVMGQQRVTALGATEGAQRAEEFIDRETRTLQARPWYFNREERVSIPISGLGWAELPPDILTADFTQSADELVVRDGRLYNKTDRTFAFTRPDNLVDDDLEAAGWTDTFTTHTAKFKGCNGPRGGADLATYLKDESAVAVEKLVYSPTLVDGTRYHVSAYVRNGPDQGAEKPGIRLVQSAANTAELGWLSEQTSLSTLVDPPILRTPGSGVAGSGTRGLMENAFLTPLDAPLDTVSEGYLSFGALTATWAYVSAEFVYDSSLGTPTFELFTHEDAAAVADTDMFIMGLQLAEMSSVTAGELQATFLLPYEDLPKSAFEYVLAKATVRFHDATLGSSDLRRELKQREEDAWADLLREDTAQADTNPLYSSHYALKFGRRRHENALLGGGTTSYLKNL